MVARSDLHKQPVHYVVNGPPSVPSCGWVLPAGRVTGEPVPSRHDPCGRSRTTDAALSNQYVQNTVVFATRLHRKTLRCSKRRTLCLGMTFVTEATTSGQRRICSITRYSGCCSNRGAHLENPHGISTTGHAIQVAHRKNNAVALVNQPV